MKNIRELKIIGIDAARPPRIRKEPYIDLYFQLSAAAPKPWCGLFNDLVSGDKYSVKIDSEQGEFIDAWVRKPSEIEPLVMRLKEAVLAATEEYLARIAAESAVKEGDVQKDSSEQAALNAIIERLDFS